MKKKIGFEEIWQASQVLHLGEYATMQEIKEAYRSLAARYHPDKCKKEQASLCEKKIREINNARDILMSYCAHYRYSFKDKDVARNSFEMEEYEYLQQFYDGWLTEL